MKAKNKVESPMTTLRRSAMDYLARREHSFHELSNKLIEKFPDFDPDLQIFPAINILRQENLQSDQRFVESYIRFRRNRGFGPVKIESELFHKGVDVALVKRELYSNDHDWFLCCLTAFEKKFSNKSQSQDSISLGTQQGSLFILKQQRFLLQRGFALDDIKSLLKP